MSLLAGKRIVTTRAEGQTREFIDMLRNVGATPIIFPTIQIVPLSEPDYAPLDSALRDLSHYDWVIFTSVNGVHNVLERMKTLNIPVSVLAACQIAAIGPATEKLLQDNGITPSLRPPEYIAESILDELLKRGSVTGKRFLLLRVDVARAVLREQLTAHGAHVDEIHVYRTVRGTPDAAAYAAIRAGVDVITFTSSSTVRHFFELLGNEAAQIANGALVACIGPITAETALDMGLRVDVQAQEYTVRGLIDALEKHYEKRSQV